MQALVFRVGMHRLALRAREVVEVLPRMPLREVAMAPEAVLGLLAFRAHLTPVVDLGLLIRGERCRPQLGTRIVVVEVGAGTSSRRYVGLLAEDVSELVPLGRTAAGLEVAEHPWLGAHLADTPDWPQLIEVHELLPEALTRLFVPEPAAS